MGMAFHRYIFDVAGTFVGLRLYCSRFNSHYDCRGLLVIYITSHAIDDKRCAVDLLGLLCHILVTSINGHPGC